MILVLHIIIALSSMLYSTFLYFSPTKTKFNVTYVLVSATLVSGTFLVISTGADILHACFMGIFYLVAVFGAIILANRKLAKVENNLSIEE